VLLNYLGKSRDVMTLAHELGHGVHQVLAAKQGMLLSQTPLTLAETASVFGEMLTFKALLRDTTDPKERKALIAGKVEDMLNTVVRQIAFYKFERKIHLSRREGELTSDNINELWMSVQAESLGEAIEFKPGYEVFWAYIGFSQFMLIWYSNIPEETLWFSHRLEHGWYWVTVALAVGHFVVPFFFLLPVSVKRSRVTLTIASLWMLAVHYLDLYWLIMPNLHKEGLQTSWLDFACLLGVGGLFLGFLAWLIRDRALIPVRDPRLGESLSFENV